MTNVARLPGPIADVWDWQLLGSCRGQDSARFFHPDGERGASRGRRENAAKAVCQSCPVRAECAAHALTTREPYGVWGGFTEAERLRLLASGWEDAADRRRTRVDVSRLERRLGMHPVPAPRMNSQHVNGQHVNSQHVNGQHVNGQHVNGQHVNGQHVHGRRSDREVTVA
jgi:WhiB family transcriptional regulator, redox-sensing transcriptional regulator